MGGCNMWFVVSSPPHLLPPEEGLGRDYVCMWLGSELVCGSLCGCAVVCLLMLVECVQILNLSAVILANLCVSYIMSSQTEDAEELMRKIEKEEVGCVLTESVLMEDRLKLVVCVCVYAGMQEKLSYEDPDRKLYHLCIVNLVIGTLYCAKGNYEFGIGRIMKSLEPYQRKVCVWAWESCGTCIRMYVGYLLLLSLAVIPVTPHSLELTRGIMPSGACCPSWSTWCEPAVTPHYPTGGR